MSTLSFKDFSQGNPVQVVGNEGNIQSQEAQAGPSFFQKLQQRVSNVGEQLKTVQQTAQDTMNATTPQEKALGTVATVAEAARTPLKVLGQAGGAIGDVIGTGIEKITGGKGSDAIAQNETIQKALKQYQDFAQKNPELASSLGDVGNLLNFIGVGEAGSAVAQVGKQAIKGSVNITGKGLKTIGEKLYQSAYTPTVAEAEKTLAYQASKPDLFSKLVGAGSLEGNPAFKPITVADTAQRAGIAGTEKSIGIQSKQVADTIFKKEIAPAVKGIKGTITKDELFAPLQERVAGITDPSKRVAFEDALNALRADYKDVSGYTFEQAQKLKSEIDQFTPVKVFKGKDVANEFRMLQHDMANTIRQKTYDALKDINVKQKYIDYGNLKELQKVGIKAISEAGTKGGFGGFWSTVYNQGMTPVKTIGGKVIYKIGDKLEVTAPKGFEGKPLSEYLKAVGYITPAVTKDSVQP